MEKLNIALESIKNKILELYSKKSGIKEDDFRMCLDHNKQVYEVMYKIHKYFDDIERVLLSDFNPRWMQFSFWRQFSGGSDEDVLGLIIGFHKTNVANIMEMTGVDEHVAEEMSYKNFVVPMLRYIGKEPLAAKNREKFKEGVAK